MKIVEGFKPNKRKLTISILITIVWYFIILLAYFGTLCPKPMCKTKNYFYFGPHIGCEASCPSIWEAVSEWWIVFAPGILFYIIYSVSELVLVKLRSKNVTR